VPTTEIVVLLMTVPDAEAGERIARALVDERLAACVNILAPMTSIYRWQGAVHRDEERQVIVKSTRDRVDQIERRLSALHPYEVPELIVLPTSGGSARYLEWVEHETRW
jgi:periplasmic divalent cation tolerance protein